MTASPSPSTADARAIGACRAAVRAGPEGAAPAAAAVLAAVDDPEELRRVVGALAHLTVHSLPRGVRRGRPVSTVLDRVVTELTWSAS